MHTAALNRWGQRHNTASALNAPIEEPATTTGCGPLLSAWIVGTTSSAIALWYWLNSHMRCSVEPSCTAMARPAVLSHA